MGKLDDVKALHYDRGDGTCRYCFESMPCVGSETGARSGIHQYEWEHDMAYWLEQSLDRQRQIDYINAVFRAAGIDCEVHSQVVGQMLSVEVLGVIAVKLDGALSLGLESLLSPEATIDEEEDDEEVLDG